MYWLNTIGRSDTNRCSCAEGGIQNSAHIRKRKKVGDGRGRTMAEAEEDWEFCAEVYTFLHAQLKEE